MNGGGKERSVSSDIITVALGERTYDIFFGEGIYPLFQEWICRFYPGGAVYVITDRNVASIYGEDIHRWLSGIPHHIHAIEPGEDAKNWETIRGIYAFLAQGNADREALVVAFGGGVVGDLAGFAAATYLRGVPYLQIPTTLVSQVDSSVGGKTGFNLQEGKNLVGAFHQPRAVFIDHGFLRTLDDRNLRSGMAEVVKSAIAGDAVLWEKLCAMGSRWRAMSGREWHDVIQRAVAFKSSVVERDERESSIRRILNLGHTIGHALEQAAGYGNLLHGEAVGMGLAWEAIFSRRLGVTPPEVDERLFYLMKEIGFALDDPSLPLTSIAGAIGMDKKRIVSELEMPMVVSPGECVMRRLSLSQLRKELPGIRAEILQRGREAAIDSAGERELLAMIEKGDLPAATAILERRVGATPQDLRAMVLLAEAYLRSGKHVGAWEMIKEALQQYPADPRTQRVAREIEKELRRYHEKEGDVLPPPLEDVIILEGGVFEIRSADPSPGIAEDTPGSPEPEPEAPPASAVRTITMANVCWEQGEKEIARRIVDEILERDPGNPRALEWKATHEERTADAMLTVFLDAIAKEYGYDLSGPH